MFVPTQLDELPYLCGIPLADLDSYTGETVSSLSLPREIFTCRVMGELGGHNEQSGSK